MARILVIDDSSELLEMVRVLIEDRGGHKAILSTDGEEGLAKAAAQKPDLAIVDVMMPGMTGYEVCRRLRATPSTSDIPIIILTARGQDVDRQAAMDAGANMYMSKPVTMGDLLESIESLLGDHEPSPSSESGQVIALVSLRGGVGVTTLAVNMAVFIARRSQEGTCLVDLCPSSGNASLQLGLRPEPNWLALADLGSDLDTESISAQLLSHTSGLSLLAAPFVPVTDGGLPHELASATLKALQNEYARVIVDLPSALNDTTSAILDMADVIGLVLTFDPASIQATVGTLQALKPHVDKIRIILNQVVPGKQPPAEALERVMRRPLSAISPFDPGQAQALTRGVPLALSTPDSPFVQSLPRLIAALQPAVKIPSGG